MSFVLPSSPSLPFLFLQPCSQLLEELYAEYLPSSPPDRPKVPTEERLLYFDGATPHLAPLVVSYAFNHGITIANYPSHSSDFLSALDVAVFSPAAHFYTVHLDAHVDGGGRVNKKAFPG